MACSGEHLTAASPSEESAGHWIIPEVTGLMREKTGMKYKFSCEKNNRWKVDHDTSGWFIKVDHTPWDACKTCREITPFHSAYTSCHLRPGPENTRSDLTGKSCHAWKALPEIVMNRETWIQAGAAEYPLAACVRTEEDSQLYLQRDLISVLLPALTTVQQRLADLTTSVSYWNHFRSFCVGGIPSDLYKVWHTLGGHQTIRFSSSPTPWLPCYLLFFLPPQFLLPSGTTPGKEKCCKYPSFPVSQGKGNGPRSLSPGNCRYSFQQFHFVKHGFVLSWISCISYLENIGSLSYAALPHVDRIHYTI